MTVARLLLLGLFLHTFLLMSDARAAELNLTEKASIQASMQRYVDANLVDGALLHLDPKDGEVKKLHPVTAHPMILKMGEHFVLCFDFRDDAGNKVPVDYYMARKQNNYVVFHSAVADRALLQRLMKSGKIERVK